jgi:uncharacterized DUF497 family protein
MEFEWDERKNQQNQRKHHLSFEEAKEIFSGVVFTAVSNKLGYDEIREISVGAIQNISIITVVHTDRNGKIRIISARKATPKKGENTMNTSRKRLEEIQNIPDEAIDTSDIPELDDHFWETAKMVTPISKKAVSLRLDSDVLDWFKSQGKGYQSMINNVLRTYVNHQEKG